MHLFGIFINSKIKNIRELIISKYKHKNLTEKNIKKNLFIYSNKHFTFYSIRINSLFGKKIFENKYYIIFFDGYAIDVNKNKFIDNINDFNLKDIDNYHGEYTYIIINKLFNTLKIIKPILSNNYLLISKNIFNSNTIFISNNIFFHSLITNITEPDKLFISNIILYRTPNCFPKTFYKNIELISPFAKISINNNILKIYDPEIEVLKDKNINTENVHNILNKIVDIVFKYCYINKYKLEFFLTGGKDSRLMFSILNKLNIFNKYNLKITTRGGPYSGDVLIAKKITNKYNLKANFIDTTSIQSTSSYYTNFKKNFTGTTLFVSSKDSTFIDYVENMPKELNFINHEYCTKESKELNIDRYTKYYLKDKDNIIRNDLLIKNINYFKNYLVDYIRKRSNSKNSNLLFKILTKYQYWAITHTRNSSYTKGFNPNILLYDIIIKLLYNNYNSKDLVNYNKFHTDIINKNDSWLVKMCPLYNATWGILNTPKLSIPDSISLESETLVCLKKSQKSFLYLVLKNKAYFNDLYNIDKLLVYFSDPNVYNYMHYYYIFIQVFALKNINYNFNNFDAKITNELIQNLMICKNNVSKIIKNTKTNYDKIINILLKLTDKNISKQDIRNEINDFLRKNQVSNLWKINLKNIIKI